MSEQPSSTRGHTQAQPLITAAHVLDIVPLFLCDPVMFSEDQLFEHIHIFHSEERTQRTRAAHCSDQLTMHCRLSG